MVSDSTLQSRRTVLKSIGAATVAAGIAGCTGGGGGGGGGGGDGDGQQTTASGGGGDSTPAADQQAQRRDITALGGITGGSGYQQCLVFQQIVQNQFPNIRVTVTGTSGWKTDAKLMWSRGKSEFGIVPAQDLWAITHGQEPYGEEQNYILMAWPGVPPSYLHVVVRKDSDIQTYSDLSGRTVNILSRGSQTSSIMPQILEGIGVTDANYQHYPHQEAANQLSQGGIDAAAAAGVAAAYGEMSQQTPVRVLSLQEENQDPLKDALPSLGFSTVDFSQYYNGAGEALVPSSWIVMAALAKLEDDFVYEMTKAVFENKGLGSEGFGIYKPFDTLSPDLVPQTGMPVHPGAYRYYEEQGVTVSDELAPPHDLPL